MSFFGDILERLFPAIKKGTGTPGDQIPHENKGDETIDTETGIAEDSGQEVNNTSIDLETQIHERGFPSKDPENPEK